MYIRVIISLRGRCLKGKGKGVLGKGVLGTRETRGAREEVMTHINTNVVASRHIKREEVLLPVAVRRSKTPELKLNFIRGKENVTRSAQSEFSGRNGFLGGNFLFGISE